MLSFRAKKTRINKRFGVSVCVIGLWDGFCSSDNGRGSGVVAKVEHLTTTSLVSTISRVRTKDLKFLLSVGRSIE
jgi:hypothetical protein